jgi:hypothetical protein
LIQGVPVKTRSAALKKYLEKMVHIHVASRNSRDQYRVPRFGFARLLPCANFQLATMKVRDEDAR